MTTIIDDTIEVRPAENEDKYVALRGHSKNADPRSDVDIEPFPIAECSDHASAYAAVMADYRKMNTDQRLVWTRPNWTAVSGRTMWLINIMKIDGTIILGAKMGPSRLEMELKREGVRKEDMAEGCLVNVLQFSSGMARFVVGNFSGPNYILGEEMDFGDAGRADGWWVMAQPDPSKPKAAFYGPFDTWEKAEALADKIETVIWGAEMAASVEHSAGRSLG
jgi:hypothetical protein